MSLKRKLLAGAAVFVVAAGVTGVGLAAGGHGRSVQSAPRQLRLQSTSDGAFLQATAQYLGTTVGMLRHETKSGRTLADVVSSTPGRSQRQLVALLVTAASSKLQLISDRAMTIDQRQALNATLRHRISGYLNDTCALALGALGKHMAGCAGMMG